jgi:hypothetical protein
MTHPHLLVHSCSPDIGSRSGDIGARSGDIAILHRDFGLALGDIIRTPAQYLEIS